MCGSFCFVILLKTGVQILDAVPIQAEQMKTIYKFQFEMVVKSLFLSSIQLREFGIALFCIGAYIKL